MILNSSLQFSAVQINPIRLAAENRNQPKTFHNSIMRDASPPLAFGAIARKLKSTVRPKRFPHLFTHSTVCYEQKVTKFTQMHDEHKKKRSKMGLNISGWLKWSGADANWSVSSRVKTQSHCHQWKVRRRRGRQASNLHIIFLSKNEMAATSQGRNQRNTANRLILY